MQPVINRKRNSRPPKPTKQQRIPHIISTATPDQSHIHLHTAKKIHISLLQRLDRRSEHAPRYLVVIRILHIQDHIILFKVHGAAGDRAVLVCGKMLVDAGAGIVEDMQRVGVVLVVFDLVFVRDFGVSGSAGGGNNQRKWGGFGSELCVADGHYGAAGDWRRRGGGEDIRL